MIAIADYGIGNLGSILNMLKKIGAPAKVASSAAELALADKLILPGVGAFDTAMRSLRDSGLLDSLNLLVLEKRIPILGVCLGMQLMTGGSEEGNLPGLGWVPGTTKRFHFEGPHASLKVPHMGWNEIALEPPAPGPSRPPEGLVSLARGLDDPSDPSRFYFVHSCHVALDDSHDVAAWTTYGYPFASIVQRRNIFGTQFHPEKSHTFGMRLLRNFVELPPC